MNVKLRSVHTLKKSASQLSRFETKNIDWLGALGHLRF